VPTICFSSTPDPHVFAEIRGESETWDIRAAILQQIEDMLPVCGEKFTVVRPEIIRFYSVVAHSAL